MQLGQCYSADREVSVQWTDIRGDDHARVQQSLHRGPFEPSITAVKANTCPKRAVSRGVAVYSVTVLILPICLPAGHEVSPAGPRFGVGARS
ncbi:hypothetical protein MKOR_23250 [Mycolicibacillus koreensis]|nr:hypothetical protein MKOR_23250 [Mycolicibacillus koreensis]